MIYAAIYLVGLAVMLAALQEELTKPLTIAAAFLWPVVLPLSWIASLVGVLIPTRPRS